MSGRRIRHDPNALASSSSAKAAHPSPAEEPAAKRQKGEQKEEPKPECSFCSNGNPVLLGFACVHRHSIACVPCMRKLIKTRYNLRVPGGVVNELFVTRGVLSIVASADKVGLTCGECKSWPMPRLGGYGFLPLYSNDEAIKALEKRTDDEKKAHPEPMLCPGAGCGFRSRSPNLAFQHALSCARVEAFKCPFVDCDGHLVPEEFAAVPLMYQQAKTQLEESFVDHLEACKGKGFCTPCARNVLVANRHMHACYHEMHDEQQQISSQHIGAEGSRIHAVIKTFLSETKGPFLPKPTVDSVLTWNQQTEVRQFNAWLEKRLVKLVEDENGIPAPIRARQENAHVSGAAFFSEAVAAFAPVPLPPLPPALVAAAAAAVPLPHLPAAFYVGAVGAIGVPIGNDDDEEEGLDGQ